MSNHLYHKMGLIEEKKLLNNEFFEQTQNDTLIFGGINVFLNKIRISDPSNLVFGDDDIVFSDFVNNTTNDFIKLKKDNLIILNSFDSKLNVSDFEFFKIENEIIINSKISNINPEINNSIRIIGDTPTLLMTNSGSIDVEGELKIIATKLLLGDSEILDSTNWSDHINIPQNYVYTNRNSNVSGDINFEDGYGIVVGNNNIKITGDGKNGYIDINKGNLFIRDGLANRISIEKSTGNTTFSGDIIVKNRIITNTIQVNSPNERPFEIIGKNEKETVIGVGNRAGGGASIILDGVNGNFTGNDYMLIGQDNSLRGRIEMISLDHVVDIRIANNNIVTFTNSSASFNKEINLRGCLRFFEVESASQNTIYKSKSKILNIHGSENGVMFLDYFGNQSIKYDRDRITLSKELFIEGNVNFGSSGDYRFNFSGSNNLLGVYNKSKKLILDIVNEELNVYGKLNVMNEVFFNEDININTNSIKYTNEDRVTHIYGGGLFYWDAVSQFNITNHLSISGGLSVNGLLKVDILNNEVVIGGNTLKIESSNHDWLFDFGDNINLRKNNTNVFSANESSFEVPNELISKSVITESILFGDLIITEDSISKTGILNILTTEDLSIVGKTITFNGSEVYHEGNLLNIPNLESENTFKGRQIFRGNILIKDFGNATLIINGTSGSYLNMYSSNGAHISHEAQNLDHGTVLRKLGRNTDDKLYVNYAESWFDGENEVRIEAKDNSIIVTTSDGVYDLKQMSNTMKILEQELENLKNIVN